MNDKKNIKTNNSIKNQVLSDMFDNEQSQEIGIFSGTLGGVIVKDLVKKGEQILMEKNGKKIKNMAKKSSDF